MISMPAQTVSYFVGLDAILDDPNDEQPGGFYRDEILAHIADELSTVVDLEVRELLSADLPMACGRDDDVGELLVMAAPGVGGQLAPAEAARVSEGLGRWGRSLRLEGAHANDAASRGVLVPPWVPPSGRFAFPAPHPLAGLEWKNMVAAAGQLEARASDDSQAAALLAMMQYCTKEKLVMSWRAAD